MKHILLVKIKASSLVEVLVAMVIFTIVLSFSLLIVSNTVIKSKMITNTYYSILANTTLMKVKNSSYLQDKEEFEEKEGVFINVVISSYNDNPEIKKIEVYISDANDIIRAKSRCLKYVRIN